MKRPPAWPFEPPHPADVFFPPFTFTNEPDDRFRAGDPFWSPDGKTWFHGTPPARIVLPGEPTTVVTKVDRERGIIEVTSK